MKNVIASNHSRIRVRKKRKGVTHLLRMAAIDFNRIDADRDDLHTARGEFRETALKTPQLGVTERSPMSPIKNQHRALRRKQIGKGDLFSILIG